MVNEFGAYEEKILCGAIPTQPTILIVGPSAIGEKRVLTAIESLYLRGASNDTVRSLAQNRHPDVRLVDGRELDVSFEINFSVLV